MVAFKKKTYTRKIKLSSDIKPIKLTLMGTPKMVYREKGVKGFLKKPKIKQFSLPKGSNPMEIFFRPSNNTVFIRYIK